MELGGGVEAVKELWSRLYAQYHEKGWGVESILFEKLIQLRHSDCESTSDYIENFVAFLNVCLIWDVPALSQLSAQQPTLSSSFSDHIVNNLLVLLFLQ